MVVLFHTQRRARNAGGTTLALITAGEGRRASAQRLHRAAAVRPDAVEVPGGLNGAARSSMRSGSGRLLGSPSPYRSPC